MDIIINAKWTGGSATSSAQQSIAKLSEVAGKTSNAFSGLSSRLMSLGKSVFHIGKEFHHMHENVERSILRLGMLFTTVAFGRIAIRSLHRALTGALEKMVEWRDINDPIRVGIDETTKALDRNKAMIGNVLAPIVLGAKESFEELGNKMLEVLGDPLFPEMIGTLVAGFATFIKVLEHTVMQPLAALNIAFHVAVGLWHDLSAAVYDVRAAFESAKAVFDPRSYLPGNHAIAEAGDHFRRLAENQRNMSKEASRQFDATADGMHKFEHLTDELLGKWVENSANAARLVQKNLKMTAPKTADEKERIETGKKLAEEKAKAEEKQRREAEITFQLRKRLNENIAKSIKKDLADTAIQIRTTNKARIQELNRIADANVKAAKTQQDADEEVFAKAGQGLKEFQAAKELEERRHQENLTAINLLAIEERMNALAFEAKEHERINRDLAEKQKELNEKGLQVAIAATQGFAQTLRQTGDIGAAALSFLNSLLDSFINKLAEIIAQQFVLKALNFLTGGAFGAFFNFGGAAGGGVSDLGIGKGYAAGGFVSGGTPGRDSVPAMLMPGEFVLPKHTVDSIRSGTPPPDNHYVNGGPVISTSPAPAMNVNFMAFTTSRAQVRKLERDVFGPERARLSRNRDRVFRQG